MEENRATFDEIPAGPLNLNLEVEKLRRQLEVASGERERARAEVDKLKADYDSEIDQFNAGYEAGKSGVPLDEAEQKWRMLNDDDHDVFAPGYTWGAWDRTQATATALRERIDELEAAAKAYIDLYQADKLIPWQVDE